MEIALQQPDSTKRCSKCGEEKSHSEFHRNKSQKDGLCGMCKSCNRAHVRSHYQANRTEILAKRREGNSRLWSSEHRAKLSAVHKGKPKSPEHVEKVRQALIGRKPSQKTVAALRAAKKRIADERLKAMLESGEKHCPQCNEMKPLSEFGKHPKGLGGFACWCLVCSRKKANAFFWENRDAFLARERAKNEKRRQNPEWVVKHCEYHREYRRKNGIFPRIKLGEIEAREHRKEAARNYWHRKVGNNPAFRLAGNISKAVWDGLRKHGEFKNGRALDVIGYNPIPALIKMGGDKPGMSIDHCIPQSDFLARIGTDYPTAKDALRAAWQLGNLQVIPKPENCAKGAKRTLLC